MKKFVFSMEKILDLRRFEQERAEAELSKAVAEVNRIQDGLNDVASKRVHAVQVSDSSSDLSFKVNSQNFLSFLDMKKEKLLNEMVQAQMAADEKRAVVREAIQKVKVLEKLREQKFKAWKKAADAEEENDSDDLNTTRHNVMV